MAEIKQAENKFYVGESITDPLAEMTFIKSGKTMIVIDHTYVSDELRGQGIAGELLAAVVSYARENNKKIKPLCAFAKQKMEDSTAYQDVLVEI